MKTLTTEEIHALIERIEELEVALHISDKHNRVLEEELKQLYALHNNQQ